MTNPLISVIMPNFNKFPHLLRSALSIYHQNYDNLEFIIVDDGSTDISPKAINILYDELKDRFNPMCYILNTVNRGKNSAINTAIPNLNGDLVMITDSDDKFYPKCITKMHEILTSNPQEGFVFSNSVLVDAHGNTIGYGISHEFDENLLLKEEKSYIPGNGLMTRDAFDSATPVDETIGVGDKVAFWRTIVKQGYKGKYINEFLYEYLLDENNKSGIGNRIKQGSHNEYLKLSDLWQEHPEKFKK